MMALISNGGGGAYVQRWERKGCGSYSYILYIDIIILVIIYSQSPLYYKSPSTESY